MRLKCTSRPIVDNHIDTQITPGLFYEVFSTRDSFGVIYYTIIGDDGIEIERPSQYFAKPQKKKSKEVVINGRKVNVGTKKGKATLFYGKCTTCRIRKTVS